MSEEQKIRDLLIKIINDYFDTFDVVDPVIPIIQIVPNLVAAYLEIRPNALEHSYETVEELNGYNGLTVPPNTIDGKFTVLINSNEILEDQKNGRLNWLGTLIHETTHVQDFSEYARIISAVDYDTIMNLSKHGMFDLWTEVNARAKGYYFVRKYTLGDAMNSEECLPDIMNKELPFQNRLLYENYHATDNGYKQAYLVAHYIGRLYTLQQLYPLVFTNDWIEDHFGLNFWMSDWFYFYQKYPTLSEAAKHFEEMRDILRQNFRGI